MPFAAPTDVADYLGRDLSEEETRFVPKLLDMVERQIVARIPDLDDRILDGVLTEEQVADVEIEVVARVARNPEGYSMETDGNYSYQKFKNLNGSIDITSEEWARLGVTTGVFVITPCLDLPWTTPTEPPGLWV